MAISHSSKQFTAAQKAILCAAHILVFGFGIWLAVKNAETIPLDAFTLVGMNLVFLVECWKNVSSKSGSQWYLSKKRKVVIGATALMMAGFAIAWLGKENFYLLATSLITSQITLVSCALVTLLKR